MGDASWFDQRARGLLSFHRYEYQGTSTAFFPVGYPGFLAFVYWLAGPELFAAKIANVLLGSLTCVLAYLIARQALGMPAARLTLLLMALFPSQIFFTSLVTTEVLFTALLCASLWLLTTARCDEGQPSSLLLAGMATGLTCLVRPIPIFLPLVLLIYWKWIKRFPAARLARAVLAVSVGIAVVLLPWVVRNASVFNGFVLVSTNGGVNFWLGQVQGGFVDPPERFTANWLRPASSPNEEITAERLAYREAFEAIEKQPSAPLLSFPPRLVRFFYADVDGLLHNSGLPRVVTPGQILPSADGLAIPAPGFVKRLLFVVSQGYYMLLLLGFAVAVAALTRSARDPRALLLLMFMAAWTLVHTVAFFPLGRYRFPLAPLIAAFAAFGFTRMAGSFRGRSR